MTSFLILLLQCVTILAGDQLSQIREEFDTFTSSLPRDSLSEEITLQNAIIDILSSYDEQKLEIFPYEHFHPNEHYGDYGEYHSLEAEVNVGVVFAGVPDNAIPRIRDLFFNDLERRDHLHIGEQQSRHVHIENSPGSSRINHQFHVVDTSFHADEAIRRYMLLLLRPHDNLNDGKAVPSSLSGGKFYINVFELEEALESLNWHMQHHLNEDNKLKKKRPSLTMYVLNLDLDMNLGAKDHLDVGSGPRESNVKHTYSYISGFSKRDLDLIRRNSTCMKLAKKLLNERQREYDVSRKIFDHSQSSHIPSLHREYESIEEMESSLSPNPTPEPFEDETWNQYYADYSVDNEDAETSIDEHFRLNEVHSSKAWALGLSDDFFDRPEVMTLEARVIRILQTTDSLSTYFSYKYELARDIVLEKASNVDNGVDDEYNPGISWVGSRGVAWLDLGAKAQSPDTLDSDLLNILTLGETLNYHDMKHVNAEESGGRGDSAIYGNGDLTLDVLKLPLKIELYSLRHSLHQHYSHCEKVLLHTRRKEIGDGPTSTDEKLANEDVLYRLDEMPNLRSSGAISPNHQQGSIHRNTKSFIDNFNHIRSSIRDGIEANHLTSYSAILYLQQAAIATILNLSVQLELCESKVDESMMEYYLELMEYHNRILGETIQLSNMFVGKGHFSRKGFSSKDIHDALATVAASVLEITRLLLSKPVTVMPHLPQLRGYLVSQEIIRKKIGK